ncbi:unnamed protein product [Notodromas monacha]|uniref:Uncharacterized protein n=1 Tax=Notodromas monacha TaxID=399045 RepID=A0A7R9G7M5_9CRUS|nr:unnamed protein product [Notodromas monacha]CAG0912410.1 unnamed protein product [Notodromas monacha]
MAADDKEAAPTVQNEGRKRKCELNIVSAAVQHTAGGEKMFDSVMEVVGEFFGAGRRQEPNVSPAAAGVSNRHATHNCYHSQEHQQLPEVSYAANTWDQYPSVQYNRQQQWEAQPENYQQSMYQQQQWQQPRIQMQEDPVWSNQKQQMSQWYMDPNSPDFPWGKNNRALVNMDREPFNPGMLAVERRTLESSRPVIERRTLENSRPVIERRPAIDPIRRPSVYHQPVMRGQVEQMYKAPITRHQQQIPSDAVIQNGFMDEYVLGSPVREYRVPQPPETPVYNPHHQQRSLGPVPQGLPNHILSRQLPPMQYHPKPQLRSLEPAFQERPIPPKVNRLFEPQPTVLGKFSLTKQNEHYKINNLPTSSSPAVPEKTTMISQLTFPLPGTFQKLTPSSWQSNHKSTYPQPLNNNVNYMRQQYGQPQENTALKQTEPHEYPQFGPRPVPPLEYLDKGSLYARYAMPGDPRSPPPPPPPAPAAAVKHEQQGKPVEMTQLVEHSRVIPSVTGAEKVPEVTIQPQAHQLMTVTAEPSPVEKKSHSEKTKMNFTADVIEQAYSVFMAPITTEEFIPRTKGGEENDCSPEDEAQDQPMVQWLPTPLSCPNGKSHQLVLLLGDETDDQKQDLKVKVKTHGETCSVMWPVDVVVDKPGLFSTMKQSSFIVPVTVSDVPLRILGGDETNKNIQGGRESSEYNIEQITHSTDPWPRNNPIYYNIHNYNHNLVPQLYQEPVLAPALPRDSTGGTWLKVLQRKEEIRRQEHPHAVMMKPVADVTLDSQGAVQYSQPFVTLSNYSAEKQAQLSAAHAAEAETVMKLQELHHKQAEIAKLESSVADVKPWAVVSAPVPEHLKPAAEKDNSTASTSSRSKKSGRRFMSAIRSKLNKLGLSSSNKGNPPASEQELNNKAEAAPVALGPPLPKETSFVPAVAYQQQPICQELQRQPSELDYQRYEELGEVTRNHLAPFAHMRPETFDQSPMSERFCYSEPTQSLRQVGQMAAYHNMVPHPVQPAQNVIIPAFDSYYPGLSLHPNWAHEEADYYELRQPNQALLGFSDDHLGPRHLPKLGKQLMRPTQFGRLVNVNPFQINFDQALATSGHPLLPGFFTSCATDTMESSCMGSLRTGTLSCCDETLLDCVCSSSFESCSQCTSCNASSCDSCSISSDSSISRMTGGEIKKKRRKVAKKSVVMAVAAPQEPVLGTDQLIAQVNAMAPENPLVEVTAPAEPQVVLGEAALQETKPDDSESNISHLLDEAITNAMGRKEAGPVETRNKAFDEFLYGTRKSGNSSRRRKRSNRTTKAPPAGDAEELPKEASISALPTIVPIGTGFPASSLAAEPTLVAPRPPPKVVGGIQRAYDLVETAMDITGQSLMQGAATAIYLSRPTLLQSLRDDPGDFIGLDATLHSPAVTAHSKDALLTKTAMILAEALTGSAQVSGTPVPEDGSGNRNSDFGRTIISSGVNKLLKILPDEPGMTTNSQEDIFKHPHVGLGTEKVLEDIQDPDETPSEAVAQGLEMVETAEEVLRKYLPADKVAGTLATSGASGVIREAEDAVRTKVSDQINTAADIISRAAEFIAGDEGKDVVAEVKASATRLAETTVKEGFTAIEEAADEVMISAGNRTKQIASDLTGADPSKVDEIATEITKYIKTTLADNAEDEDEDETQEFSLMTEFAEQLVTYFANGKIDSNAKKILDSSIAAAKQYSAEEYLKSTLSVSTDILSYLTQIYRIESMKNVNSRRSTGVLLREAINHAVTKLINDPERQALTEARESLLSLNQEPTEFFEHGQPLQIGKTVGQTEEAYNKLAAPNKQEEELKMISSFIANAAKLIMSPMTNTEAARNLLRRALTHLKHQEGVADLQHSVRRLLQSLELEKPLPESSEIPLGADKELMQALKATVDPETVSMLGQTAGNIAERGLETVGKYLSEPVRRQAEETLRVTTNALTNLALKHATETSQDMIIDANMIAENVQEKLEPVDNVAPPDAASVISTNNAPIHIAETMADQTDPVIPTSDEEETAVEAVAEKVSNTQLSIPKRMDKPKKKLSRSSSRGSQRHSRSRSNNRLSSKTKLAFPPILDRYDQIIESTRPQEPPFNPCKGDQQTFMAELQKGLSEMVPFVPDPKLTDTSGCNPEQLDEPVFPLNLLTPSSAPKPESLSRGARPSRRKSKKQRNSTYKKK